MHIRVRINSARHRTRGLYDGHRHPFFSKVVKGWHARPGNETVTIDLFEQADQSPSGTGRAQFHCHTAVDMHPTNLSASNESDRHAALNAAVTTNTMVDPRTSASTSSLGNLARLMVEVRKALA